MGKFPEAANRILFGIFVCRRCTAKIRAPSLKVTQGKVACRKCGYKRLRPKRKK